MTDEKGKGEMGMKMKTLIELPVKRIVKIIELEDCIIVRYKSEFSKKPVYCLYYRPLQCVDYVIPTYDELLRMIRLNRGVNKKISG